MKTPRTIRRQWEQRFGRRDRQAIAAPELSPEELDEALRTLPPDIDPAELLEFVEAGGLGPRPDPVFRERLRRLLWDLITGRVSAPPEHHMDRRTD